MEEITIRKALPEDASAFADCHISCWQSAYKGIVPVEYLENMTNEKEQRTGRYIQALTDPGDCEYYCVVSAETMIGFLIINKSRYDDSSFIGEIFLWVFEDNMRARLFYEKHGFAFDGTKREVQYGKPLVQLRYVLNS